MRRLPSVLYWLSVAGLLALAILAFWRWPSVAVESSYLTQTQAPENLYQQPQQGQLLLQLQEDLKELLKHKQYKNPAPARPKRSSANASSSDESPMNRTKANVDVDVTSEEELQAQAKNDFEKFVTEGFDKRKGKKRRMKAKDAESYLPKEYNKYEIPQLAIEKDGETVYLPVPASVMINLRSVLEIDEEKEIIVIDMDFMIAWVNLKLLNASFIDKVYDLSLMEPMPSSFIDKIWIPDINIDNVVKISKLSFMEPSIALSFSFLTGGFMYKERLVTSVKCGMEFSYYPADTQVCQFTFRSYSYSVDDLTLGWAVGTLGVFLQSVTDANFYLRIGDVEQTIVPDQMEFGANKTFHALSFKLYARRKLSFQLIQTYIPSVFFVVITWLCFLLPSNMVELRLGITMTTLLTLTAMFVSVRDSTPAVSYYKAIDIWMLVCSLFIFVILVQFSIMSWVNHHRSSKGEENAYSETATAIQVGEPKPGSNSVPHVSAMVITVYRYETVANFFDKHGFILYTVLFLGFSIGYWTWLLTASHYLG